MISPGVFDIAIVYLHINESTVLMFPRTNVSTDKVVSPLWLRSLSLLEVDRPLHTALRMAKLPISDVGGSMEQPAGFMLHTGLSGL